MTPGAEVTVRGERWRVTGVVPHADCTALRLAGEGRTNTGRRLTVLQPFDHVREISTRGRIELVMRRRWWRTLRHLITCQQPFPGLGVLASARIELLPYQLEPALAMLRHGRLRLLVADDVGLGKTIEAAAILAVLAAEGPDLRALVVCPAGLRQQWRTELAGRFGLASTMCDLPWLLDAARDLPPTVNPWALPGIHITSIDMAKRPEVLRALEDVTWDLAIFDEAHALTPGTARRAAAHALAGRSRRVLLLTATPPDGDPGHLASLLSLGQAPGGDTITILRRTRAHAGIGVPRHSRLLPVRLSLAERRMHRLLADYTTLLWRDAAARQDVGARLVTVLLRKRALSTARSLALSLDRRLALLGREPACEAQLLLPLCDEDPLDDLAPDVILGARGLDDVAQERRLLQELHQVADAAARDESKVRVLRRFLGRAQESAIVFTEYCDTLTGLASSLVDHQPLQLHGGMPAHERADTVARFAAHGGLLLATDAASEGLNLQHCCRLVIHFELPWNPLRLEQRAGRVDRLGQARRVHEVLFVARHTAERLVLAPLVRRLVTARRTRGGQPAAWFTESDVATAILEGRPEPDDSTPPVDIASGSPTLAAEAEQEVRHLTLLRAAGNPARGDRAPAIIVHWPRTAGDRVVVVVRVAGEVAGGLCLASTLLPLEVEVGAPGLDGVISGRTIAQLVSHWQPLLADFVRQHFRTHTPPWGDWRPVVRALVQREKDIGAVAASPSRQLVQRGLFDRRAERAADERRQVNEALHQESEARMAWLMAQSAVRQRVEIVAVFAGEKSVS